MDTTTRGTVLLDADGARLLEIEAKGASVFLECGGFCAEFDRAALEQAFRLEMYGPGEVIAEAAAALDAEA